MIVPQTGSRSALIHHHRGIYLYIMNYYEIEKQHLHLIHKLIPRKIQVKPAKLSVLKFHCLEFRHL